MKAALKFLLMFALWCLTSFLSHHCGKVFLQLTSTTSLPLISATALTIVQCGTCLMLIEVFPNCTFKVKIVLMVSHFVVTFTTNYSMTFIEAASTQAIKMSEPLFMAIAQHTVMRSVCPAETIISLPVVIAGSLIFVGQFTGNTDHASIPGVSLALVSNVTMAIRNTIIKTLHQNNTNTIGHQILFRSSSVVCLVLACEISLVVMLYLLDLKNLVPTEVVKMNFMLLMSGVMHVLYSYISTNLILKEMSVVSHSLANVSKRLLVILLLYLGGNRHATLVNFYGLVLAVVGLALYTFGKYKTIVGQIKLFNIITGARFVSPVRIGLFLICTVCIFSLSVLQTHPIRNSPVQVTSPSPWSWTDVLDNKTSTSQFISSSDFEVNSVDEKEFLKWRLVEHPNMTNVRAKSLTDNKQLVDEAQRVLLNLLEDLIGNASHVMLLEIAVYNNKGDPAISAGEVLLLRKLNKKIVYYCETFKCNLSVHLNQAYEISKQYRHDDLVILMQGGGNLVGYPLHDEIRNKIIRLFPNHLKIVLSQSIWLYNNGDHFERCKTIYSNKPNLVMFLRDPRSFLIAKKHFIGIRHILAPDMAFGLGILPRQMPPFYDIIWLKRKDLESSGYQLPKFPENVSVHVSDWTSEWESNVGTKDLETVFLIAQDGIEFFLRGRVVVTDRLHGHILSVLLNIPHVLVDNPPHFKLSTFDQCWTKSLRNVIRAVDSSQALGAALQLLSIYNETLPPVVSRNT